MDDITRPEHLRSQYDTDDKLATRTSVWQPTDDGRDPSNEAFKAIDRAMTGDSDVLEVGCGTGAMAERIAALPGVTLVAIDWSDAFVELARARGSTPARATSATSRSRTTASTSSTPAGCSTTCATSTGRSRRSGACCVRAAPSSR